jgi:hypothetical protein
MMTVVYKRYVEEIKKDIKERRGEVGEVMSEESFFGV